jgi:hypothetical protein
LNKSLCLAAALVVNKFTNTKSDLDDQQTQLSNGQTKTSLDDCHTIFVLMKILLTDQVFLALVKKFENLSRILENSLNLHN